MRALMGKEIKPGYVGCRLGHLAYILIDSDAGATYSKPSIDSEGVITYTPNGDVPPPGINGYVRDQDDKWKFLPLWPECITRQPTLRQNTSKGILNVIMTCKNPSCGKLNKQVNSYTCTACPLREGFNEIAVQPDNIPSIPAYRIFQTEFDGTIVYDKIDGQWEPPRDITGYIRDSEDAWRFRPIIWKDCVFRDVNYFQRKSCGCLDAKYTCLNQSSPTYKQEIQHKTCENCPFLIDNSQNYVIVR